MDKAANLRGRVFQSLLGRPATNAVGALRAPVSRDAVRRYAGTARGVRSGIEPSDFQLKLRESKGVALPESRLPRAMTGGIEAAPSSLLDLNQLRAATRMRRKLDNFGRGLFGT